MTRIGKPWARSALFLALLGLAHACLAGEYDGRWELKDSWGKPFEVTLRPDGTADGTHNDAMKHGSWAEKDGAAVIHWDTGWTTRIAREGKAYVKTAYKPGTTPADKPTNHSDAWRIDEAKPDPAK